MSRHNTNVNSFPPSSLMSLTSGSLITLDREERLTQSSATFSCNRAHRDRCRSIILEEALRIVEGNDAEMPRSESTSASGASGHGDHTTRANDTRKGNGRSRRSQIEHEEDTVTNNMDQH
jgi:hypothetical protein